MLSCGRVKTELFETVDITASTYDVSEHAHGSLGIMHRHFDCLFSFVEFRPAKFECSSVFLWTGIFPKTLLVWPRILFTRIKKDAFSKISKCARTRRKLAVIILCRFQVKTMPALRKQKTNTAQPGGWRARCSCAWCRLGR